MDEDLELIRGINSLRTEVEAGQACGDLSGRGLGLALGLFLLQRVNQLDGREEADLSAMMLDGLDTEGGGDMGLAGARTTDQNGVLGTVQERATVQLAPRSISVASLISLVAKSKPDRSL